MILHLISRLKSIFGGNGGAKINKFLDCVKSQKYQKTFSTGLYFQIKKRNLRKYAAAFSFVKHFPIKKKSYLAEPVLCFALIYIYHLSRLPFNSTKGNSAYSYSNFWVLFYFFFFLLIFLCLFKKIPLYKNNNNNKVEKEGGRQQKNCFI